MPTIRLFSLMPERVRWSVGQRGSRPPKLLRRDRLRVTALAALVALAVGALGEPPTAATAPAGGQPVVANGQRHAASAGADPALQAALEGLVQAGAPGVMAQVRMDDHKGYLSSGVADLGTGEPPNPNLHFRIASITKAFVATVILQLEAEGRLHLDDTVDRWLPGVVTGNGNDGSKITLRMLLESHQWSLQLRRG